LGAKRFRARADWSTKRLMSANSHGAGHGHGKLSALVLGSLGIVFGDIGTSPLYALQECLTPPHGLKADPDSVLGLLSLIFWSITLVVTVKYLTFVMRADNRGEGGILALLALVPQRLQKNKIGGVTALAVLVLAGAALLYGDGMITPAISVLSAVEGLKNVTPNLEQKYIVAIACAILLALFAIQSKGTAGIGRFFGPIMAIWFATLAVLGVYHLAENPSVLRAVNPTYALALFAHHKYHAFVVLGSVVLSVTGGEALYADMGHFGIKSIRIAWLFFAMPALLLNYFGMGAMVLKHPDPEMLGHLFFAQVPQGAPAAALCILATCATIIASQALISGAFSLTSQAVQLGFFPRVTVKHTSHEAEGQIYIPEINWILCVACLALVLGLQQSSRLAAAYGIAVTGTMAITSVVFFVVTVFRWRWPLWKALPLLLVFLTFDLAFFGANILKFVDGGYIPVVVAVAFLTVMLVWRRGRRLLGEYIKRTSPPLDDFIADLANHAPVRLSGIGVYMCSLSQGVPPVLAHHTKRLGVLHEKVVLLTILFAHDPVVEPEQRATTEDLGKGFVRVVANYGFMETPDVPELLQRVGLAKKDAGPRAVTYFLGRETFLASNKGSMGPIGERLFAFLARNAQTATAYFAIPPEQVIEVGYQIDL
jgi:KUP system potassium uptake protein